MQNFGQNLFNQELADFEADHEKFEGKYSIMKNNVNKRLKKVEN